VFSKRIKQHFMVSIVAKVLAVKVAFFKRMLLLFMDLNNLLQVKDHLEYKSPALKKLNKAKVFLYSMNKDLNNM
jgi:hypothetical protein